MGIAGRARARASESESERESARGASPSGSEEDSASGLVARRTPCRRVVVSVARRRVHAPSSPRSRALPSSSRDKCRQQQVFVRSSVTPADSVCDTCPWGLSGLQTSLSGKQCVGLGYWFSRAKRCFGRTRIRVRRLLCSVRCVVVEFGRQPAGRSGACMLRRGPQQVSSSSSSSTSSSPT